MADGSPLEGKVIGHYHVRGRLGAGGMGVVYSAYDTVLERKVAIKVVGDRVLVNKTARDLLLREARTASSLNHPNICTIHEVGDSDGEAYIVMEQVEGQPLSSLLETDGLSADLVTRYGAQIADALSHAHEHGVIHRDLKSTNVVVTPQGRVKVLDFGLASRLRDAELRDAVSSKVPLTESRMIVGTLPYLAPELLRGEPAEARTDIWALGVLLYEMATGAHPFRGATAFELSSAILRDAPTPLPASVPSGLRAVILRCLQNSPNDRFQSVAEVYSALLGLQSGVSALSVAGRPEEPGDGVAWKRYAVLAACVVVLASILVAYHFWPQSKTSIGPAKITQISQWNKPMNDTFLSPDGHAIAFDSPVGGVAQVFLMLTSGGETLQLTSDEGDKTVDAFSPDGKEIYYGRSLGHDEVWVVPTLGGAPRRVAAAWYALPSADGASVYYDKSDRPGIFRANKSGLNEELIYSSQDPTLRFFPALLFPGGNDLLAVAFPRDSPNVRNFFRINLTTHEAVDLGQVVRNGDAAWAEPGKTLLFSRTVNGLTNIWRYALLDRSLTQITFGTGPDFFPMRDPGGEGIYYVNGKSTGYLTAYHVHSKESVDIVAEDATQPAISPDGKRVMYITLPSPYKTDPWVSDKTELWVSDIEGGKKVKVAAGVSLQTGTWASDNFHLTFIEAGVRAASRAYIVGADGTGLTQLPPTGAETNTAVWSPDHKSVYLSVVEKVGSMATVWKWRVGDSSLEKFVDDCGQVSDVDPSGRYLLGNVLQGERIGIYEVSVSDKRCFPLLPGIPTFAATFARDGKSFMYAVSSGGDVKIYRQPWKKGKTVGTPQVALKVPFVFPLAYQGNGNAYDFSKDLSTIVYARPGGHADLYFLSQK
jgi:serine/threonine protein kinase